MLLAEPVVRVASPVGVIELGRRAGGQDPYRAIRFRVRPWAQPGRSLRLRLTPHYVPMVLVQALAENGYALGGIYVPRVPVRSWRAPSPVEQLKGMSDDDLLALGQVLGWSKRRIAAQLCVARQTLVRDIQARGLEWSSELEARRIAVELSDEFFVSLHHAGWSLGMVAKALDCDVASVHREYVRRGLPRWPPGNNASVRKIRRPEPTAEWYACTPQAVMESGDREWAGIEAWAMDLVNGR